MTMKQNLLSNGALSPILIVAAFVVGAFVGSRWIEGQRQPAEPAAAAPATAPAERATIAAGQTVVGFMDTAEGKPLLYGKTGGDLTVSGWAACADAGSPAAKVEILIDEKAVATAAPAAARPDAAAAYGRPDFEKSGWKASVSLKGVAAGGHQLGARVTCSKGESGLLPAFRLVAP